MKERDSIIKQIEDNYNELQVIEEKLVASQSDDDTIQWQLQAHDELDELLYQEEMEMRQHSKIEWSTLGDSKTSFLARKVHE